MPVSEQCLREFRDIFDAVRWAGVARESLRRGYTESAIQAINWAEYHLQKMKGTPEYDKAQDLLSKARAARMTQPDLAIGYLVDIEPLIEQGALQKVVACECQKKGSNPTRLEKVIGDKISYGTKE